MCTKHTSLQASQRGEPRPIFVAEDGGPIFPVEGDEMEHTWFLTEMSKRKLAAEQTAADAIEEGVETEEEEDTEDDAPRTKDNQLLSDDDPSSPFSPCSPTFLFQEERSTVHADNPFTVGRGFTSELPWSRQQVDSVETASSSLS